MRACAIGLLIAGVACTPPSPIQPPAPRHGTPVSAPFSRTWGVAVAMVAENNVSPERLDRENGLIISNAVSLAPNDTLADCGKAQGFKPRPTEATWNLLITGDSARSFVRMNISYVRVGAPRTILARLSAAIITESCATLGTAEASFEQIIRARAEGKRP